MGIKLDELCKNFNKKYKETLVQKGLTEYNYQRIPFTSPRLNYMTFGGIPIGKLVEFYGEEHGGKTTTALDIVANYQKMENAREVLYADCENTLDTEWAEKLGVDVDSMTILKPTSQGAEDLFDFISAAMDTGEIGLVVIDSLGVMLSNQAMEKDIAEKTYGGIAMALTNFSKRAEGICQRHKCTVIGINQMRDDLGNPYGGTTTTGGKAWKHNCIARLEFRKGKYIDERGNELNSRAESPCGNLVQVSMTKNKSCPPTRRLGYYTLKYDTGIDYLADLVELAIKFGAINKSGAWFDIIDISTGEIIEGKIHGQSNVLDYLKENKSVLDMIDSTVNKLIKEN